MCWTSGNSTMTPTRVRYPYIAKPGLCFLQVSLKQLFEKFHAYLQLSDHFLQLCHFRKVGCTRQRCGLLKRGQASRIIVVHGGFLQQSLQLRLG